MAVNLVKGGKVNCAILGKGGKPTSLKIPVEILYVQYAFNNKTAPIAVEVGGLLNGRYVRKNVHPKFLSEIDHDTSKV